MQLSQKLLAPGATCSRGTGVAAPHVSPVVRSRAPVAVRKVSASPSLPQQSPLICKVAAPEAATDDVSVTVDQSTDPTYTVISVQANNKPGLLTSITVRNYQWVTSARALQYPPVTG